MKRKSGLQKKISSIFKGINLDEASSPASKSTEAADDNRSPAPAPAPPAASQSAPPLPTETSPATPAQPNQATPDKIESIPLKRPTVPAQTRPPKPIIDLPKPATDANNQKVGSDKRKIAAKPMIFDPQQKDESAEPDSVNGPEEPLMPVKTTSGRSQPTSSKPAMNASADSREKTKAAARQGTPRSRTGSTPKKDAMTRAYERRQKKMKVLIGLLAAVFILAMTWAFNPNLLQSTPTKVSVDTIEPLQTILTAGPRTIQWTLPDPYPSGLRDPMVEKETPKPVKIDPVVVPDVQPDVPEPTHPTMAIKGIVFSEDRPSVIIDQDIYFVGETVQGVRIIKVTRDSVTFENDKEQWIQTYGADEEVGEPKQTKGVKK